jgi:hypothetical protein
VVICRRENDNWEHDRFFPAPPHTTYVPRLSGEDEAGLRAIVDGIPARRKMIGQMNTGRRPGPRGTMREVVMTTVAKLLAQKQRLLERLQKNDPGPHEREEIERLRYFAVTVLGSNAHGVLSSRSATLISVFLSSGGKSG